MRLAHVRGICEAQRVTRAVIHEVADTLEAGQSEREVAERIEARLERAGAGAWLHTPYAWFGERTRFSGFDHWEPDALPTDRILEEGDAFILDAAPLVDGSPADYALCGRVSEGASAEHREMLRVLTEVKDSIVAWARDATTGRALNERVDRAFEEAGFEVIHDRYPASVLGHSFDWIPEVAKRIPRVGKGFQLSLVGTYAVSMAKHRLLGAPYPFINPLSPDRPQGLYAVEPHLARDGVGAKFESVLLVDGDETRWLDPELFGEVEG